jgi:hypothetical protein
LDLEKFKSACNEKIGEAVDKAIEAATCANGKARVQTDKDVSNLANAYEKALIILDKRLDAMDTRMDAADKRFSDFMKYVYGTAIASLITAIMLLAGILLGKI